MQAGKGCFSAVVFWLLFLSSSLPIAHYETISMLETAHTTTGSFPWSGHLRFNHTFDPGVGPGCVEIF